MKVLHLIGSPTTDFNFNCSLMYARSLLESSYPAVLNNNNIVALVHTSGLWSFPLGSFEDADYKTVNSVTMEEAVEIIRSLNPDVMVQHIQCERRHLYNAIFELLNIPYIGSDAHVSANIVDKGITRAILLQAGVPVPTGLVMTKYEPQDYKGPFPVVVKPTKMENSVGVTLVYNKAELDLALSEAWQYGDTAVIDSFITGREVRCGVMEVEGGEMKPLSCLEYQVNREDIRKYEDKLEGDEDSDLRQAPVTTWFIEETEEPKLVKKLQNIAMKIHRALGCKDFSQYDCRVTDEGEVFVLEVNSFCSFGPLSLLPKMAAKQGVFPQDFYSTLLKNAAKRTS